MYLYVYVLMYVCIYVYIYVMFSFLAIRLFWFSYIFSCCFNGYCIFVFVDFLLSLVACLNFKVQMLSWGTKIF